MNKEQLIKELNSYSKEEIIEAIADTDKIIAARITSKLFKKKRKSIDLLIDAAFNIWQQANDELIAYLNQTNEEYKGVCIYELPAEVKNKLLKLSDAEEQADNDLRAMYKKRDTLYEKTR